MIILNERLLSVKTSKLTVAFPFNYLSNILNFRDIDLRIKPDQIIDVLSLAVVTINETVYNAVLNHKTILFFDKNWNYKYENKINVVVCYMIVVDNLLYFTVQNYYQISAYVLSPFVEKYSNADYPGSSRQIAYYDENIYVANNLHSQIDIFNKTLKRIKTLHLTFKKPHGIAFYGTNMYICNNYDDFEIKSVKDNYKSIRKKQIEGVYSIFISSNGDIILSNGTQFALYDYELNLKLTLEKKGAFNAGLDSNGRLFLFLNVGFYKS